MSVSVIRAGLQSTIQSSPRTGQRHLGVAASGPADPLSMALANHLLGNTLMTPALEITLSGIDLRFATEMSFAVAGAPSDCTLNGDPVPFHETCTAGAGDELHIGSATSGARVYVAVVGGFVAEEFLGSRATYLPAAFGGFGGRALQDGDRLDVTSTDAVAEKRKTPEKFRPPTVRAWALRACDGIEIATLKNSDRDVLFDTNFTVGARADRMGLQLQGGAMQVDSAGRLPSAPVFPGCVQCPENGAPFLLSVDAQTTGGYARIAQVARVDRHILGQLRQGDHLRLLRRTAKQARVELQEKLNYWREWLPDIESVI